ncbi:hypothetical protein F4777DRAFT_583596 [Nemania sp. FL0916]|nr:hypothetical protein F4777DRAFT_583596 [Nemania sp. FL0916]
MATPRLAQYPTCLSCLRRLARPSFAPAVSNSLSWTQTQTQTRSKVTKAELEDLQGIPVRLLRDIPRFGRKHAIIRVKAGRMRNIWFPKAAAEYMTRKRFTEMGLTEAAIGTRDRSFGVLQLIDEKEQKKLDEEMITTEDGGKAKRKNPLALPPEEARELLTTLLPKTLIFTRKPVTLPPAPTPAAPPPEPVVPRSPSLAANAATSTAAPLPEQEQPQAPTVTPIYGSVSLNHILAIIKEKLVADDPEGQGQGARVVLEPEALELTGLDPEHDGENRIKRLGTFGLRISFLDPATDGTKLEPVDFVVEVVAGEEAEKRSA